MGSKTISGCAACGYPLKAENVGQRVNCPFCSTINEAIGGIEIPTTLFWSAIAFIAGVALSPRIRRQTSKYAG